VRDVLVIGASAGGHSAVVEILSRLPQDLPAFIGVVIHRGAVSEHTSTPEYAIAHDHVRAALTVDEIGDALALLARERAVGIDIEERIGLR
jgi:CheB methylesterase